MTGSPIYVRSDVRCVMERKRNLESVYVLGPEKLVPVEVEDRALDAEVKGR